MKTRWTILAVVAPALLAATGFAYLKLNASGGQMTAAAETFVKSLSSDQAAKAVLAYGAPQRTDWHYIPKPERKGLQIKEMNDAQRKAAHALLRSSLSAAGYDKATRIMQLESILRELEKSRGAGPIRDPERYYFTLFGQPGATRWGLSVEGHHLSLNFVVENDKVLSSTPTFFGANPATLMADYGGDFKKGDRVLAKEETLAFALVESLNSEQRSAAIIADKAPKDIRGAGQPAAPASAPEGLAAGKLTREQLAILRTLVDEYAHNLPDDVAAQRLATIERDGWDAIRFAWSGAEKPGVGHHYQIQGKSFLIEFNNTQPDSAGNIANHIHSVWHDLAGNFALPAGK